MNHFVALSGGKDSTALWLRLLELTPQVPYQAVITPTGDELPEMIDHWKMLSDMIDMPLRVVSCGESLDSLERRQRALPNWRQRWCTRMLKIEPYEAFLAQSAPAVSYVGLRADEEDRKGMEFRIDLPGVKIKFPMKSWGWRLTDVQGYLRGRGVSIPKRTDCGCCFFQTLGEWWELWKTHPAIYQTYVEKEAWVSEERGKETTYRSPGRDTWPASLAALRDAFQTGHIPRGADVQGDMFHESRCRTCTL